MGHPILASIYTDHVINLIVHRKPKLAAEELVPASKLYFKLLTLKVYGSLPCYPGELFD